MIKKFFAIGKVLMTVLLILITAASLRFGYLGAQSAKMKVKLGVVNNELVNCPDKAQLYC